MIPKKTLDLLDDLRDENTVLKRKLRNQSMTHEEALVRLRECVAALEGAVYIDKPLNLQERLQWAECGWDFRINDLAFIDLKRRRERVILES